MKERYRNMESLGDYLKALEGANRMSLLPGVPIYARLDGKSFSKFTRGMGRPFDDTFRHMMIETAKELLKQTSADLAYTQSDEISLYWENNATLDQMLYSGRYEKMLGELVGIATAKLYQMTHFLFPDRISLLPRFDARIMSCSLEDVANFFIWREMDATKNSISQVSHYHFSQRELMGKSSKKRREMLFEAGDPWEKYSDDKKRGVYVKKFLREVPVNTQQDIPEKAKVSLPEKVNRKVPLSFTRNPIHTNSRPEDVLLIGNKEPDDLKFL